MEVPPSHAKMCLKSALQKLSFSMAKAIQKCYTLNCSLKCPCRFPHIYTRYATSFSRKIILYETNNIFYSLGNQKWEKTNSWSLKYIANKYEVTLKRILLMSAVICIWKILHGNEIKQYLKNYKHHKVQQHHSREYL